MCLFMCRRREKSMEGITMLDPKKVRLGICPIGWSNDDMWISATRTPSSSASLR